MKKGDQGSLVWLVSPYEVPPGRGYRVGRWENLARVLTDAGHEVVVVISDYCHGGKEHRGLTARPLDLGPRWSVVSLPGFAYKTNISIRRLVAEFLFAIRLLVRFWNVDRAPDAIVCKEPPAIVGLAALLLSRRFGAVHVSDIVDLWPELFEKVLPGFRPTLFAPAFWMIRCMRTLVLGKSHGVVSYAARFYNVVDVRRPRIVVYNGLPTRASSGDSSEGAEEAVDGTPLRVVYLGTIGNNYDIKTVLDVAERLSREGREVHFTFAGYGPLAKDVAAVAERIPGTVTYLGRLPFEDIPSLLAASDIGLMPYVRGSTVELPDKFYDYIAAGLPMITSIHGEVGEILETEGCGCVYSAEDVDSLYQSIVKVRDAGQIGSMRRAARRIRGRFAAEIQFARYRTFIEELIDRKAESRQ